MVSAKIGPPVLPEVLRDVPRAIIRALEPSDVLWSALVVLKLDGGFGPAIAFDGLRSYLEAARRQKRRIQRANRRLQSSLDAARRQQRQTLRAKTNSLRGTRPQTEPLFDEVHFYLVCWVRIGKLGRFIARETHFRQTNRVLRRYGAELDEYRTARNHLEHFEERLPGGKNQHELATTNDLLNMQGNSLTYGGRRIDIGPTSFHLLTELVSEFRAAVLFDSIEALAATYPKGLNGHLQRAASKARAQWAVRKVGRKPRVSGPITAKPGR